MQLPSARSSTTCSLEARAPRHPPPPHIVIPPLPPSAVCLPAPGCPCFSFFACRLYGHNCLACKLYGHNCLADCTAYGRPHRAGGQDAMSVTMTSAKQGKFETKIYHKARAQASGAFRWHCCYCLQPPARPACLFSSCAAR